jgi:FkbM family methyltransferase
MSSTKISFKQLHLFFFIKYLFVKIFLKYFKTNLVETYTFFGEDRILEQWININETGIYVDVGSNHPIKGSNSFKLYKKGWTGICVDGNQDLIKLSQKVRPKDINIHAYVSDSESELFFTEFENNSVSSFEDQHIQFWQNKSVIKSKKLVKTVTLNTLLKQNQIPSNFQVLSIDVEGHDYNILLGIDLLLYHPRLIIIEILNFDLTLNNDDHIVTFLERFNYRLKAYNGINAFFVKDNNSESDFTNILI